MQPLTTWICDTCGNPITDTNASLVISRRIDNNTTGDYRIVHKNIGDLTCDPGFQGGYAYSLELSTFLGQDGLAWLLSELSVGKLREGQGTVQVDDMDKYVDFIRRVQVPWYEEARQRFDDPEVRRALDDANEVFPYTPDTLERIAKGEIG